MNEQRQAANPAEEDASSFHNEYCRRAEPYDRLRVAFGLLLISAADLKAHQLVTKSLLVASALTSRRGLIPLTEFESALVTGAWPAILRRIAIFNCVASTSVSVYQSLTGANSFALANIGLKSLAHVSVDPAALVILDYSRGRPFREQLQL
jgi:hypothetical protein